MLEGRALEALVGLVVGLLIGSFLNVVIHRLPRMLYRGWLTEAVSSLSSRQPGPSLWQLVFGLGTQPPGALVQEADAAVEAVEALPLFNLAQPRSRCGHCGHAIRWFENIPVLSFLFLRGRCSGCATRIGWRYPLVELITGVLLGLCAWRFGLTVAGGFWAMFCIFLICQFAIDLDTQLLPDSLNFSLLWLGLIGAALHQTSVSLSDAVWGAVGGYLFLWLIFHAYRLITGKEGMGYGDFKLLSALGAWLGVQYLVAIVLMSSLVGALLGSILLMVGKITHKDVPIAFGPFLAGAGLLCFALDPAHIREWMPMAFPFSVAMK